MDFKGFCGSHKDEDDEITVNIFNYADEQTREKLCVIRARIAVLAYKSRKIADTLSVKPKPYIDKERTTMVDLANISADLDEIFAGIVAQKAEIQVLKDKLAAGLNITLADLEALDVKTEAAKALFAQADPPPPPA